MEDSLSHYTYYYRQNKALDLEAMEAGDNNNIGASVSSKPTGLGSRRRGAFCSEAINVQGVQ